MKEQDVKVFLDTYGEQVMTLLNTSWKTDSNAMDMYELVAAQFPALKPIEYLILGGFIFEYCTLLREKQEIEELLGEVAASLKAVQN